MLESCCCEGPAWWECWGAARGRDTGVRPASPKHCLLLHVQQRQEQLQRCDGSVRGLPIPGCAPCSSRGTVGLGLHRLSQQELGTIHQLIPSACFQWGQRPFTLPESQALFYFTPGWGFVRGHWDICPSRQSTISPFPLLSMAKSRSPAVLINGRSGKERGLASALVCVELAGAAACLLPGTQAGLARHRCLAAARPADGRACRQPCSQLALPGRAGGSGPESCLPESQELGWGTGI